MSHAISRPGSTHFSVVAEIARANTNFVIQVFRLNCHNSAIFPFMKEIVCQNNVKSHLKCPFNFLNQITRIHYKLIVQNLNTVSIRKFIQLYSAVLYNKCPQLTRNSTLCKVNNNLLTAWILANF